MKLLTIAGIISLYSAFCSAGVLAYDCSGLPDWQRQAYYLNGAQVQYLGVAYENTGEPSKRDVPDQGFPWSKLGDRISEIGESWHRCSDRVAADIG